MIRISIDVGGTFTDLVALDEETRMVENIKVPSVPRNSERGVRDAFRVFLRGHPPRRDPVDLLRDHGWRLGWTPG